MNFETLPIKEDESKKYLSPELMSVSSDVLFAKHLGDMDRYLTEQGLEHEDNLEMLTSRPNTIIRRESPEAIERMLNGDDAIEVNNSGPDGDIHPNSAIIGRSRQGLRIPFSAGFSSSAGGKIVSIAGWRKSEDIREFEYDRRKYSHYNDHTISVQGKFTRDDLEFLIIRVPKNEHVRSSHVGESISGSDLIDNFPDLGLSADDVKGFDYFIYKNRRKSEKKPYADVA